jgi:hypothetical protein
VSTTVWHPPTHPHQQAQDSAQYFSDLIDLQDPSLKLPSLLVSLSLPPSVTLISSQN